MVFRELEIEKEAIETSRISKKRRHELRQTEDNEKARKIQSSNKDESWHVETMHNLYDLMFKIAKENCKEAQKCKDTCNPDGMTKELKHSTLAILMSYCCLEAYINRISYDKLGRSPDLEKQKKWIDLRGDETKGYKGAASTRKKWLDIAKEVTKTNEIFDKKSELWKSFEHLNDLRNFIVHYKGVPKPQDPRSKWRCGKYPLTEAQKKINPCEAKKAVETTDKMIRKLNKLMQAEAPRFLESAEEA